MANQQVTFWLGCHVLRHSDIIRASVAILEDLGVDVRAVGGPRYCCGTIKDMNVKVATTMGQGAARRLADVGAPTVITYCPSCQTHLDDFISETMDPEFDHGHFVKFLHERRDQLSTRLVHPIRRRVALHLHSGFQAKVPVNKMVLELLQLIPGLEVVPHEVMIPGIHCTGAMVAMPGMADRLEASLRQLQREHSLDEVITLYHSCQRSLCIHDGVQGLGVVNFVKLLATSMGIDCEQDILKNWKVGADEGGLRKAVGPDRIERVGEETFARLILPEFQTKRSDSA